MTRESSPSATPVRALDYGMLVIPALWAVLWWCGWPRAHIDDLFFTGTAIEWSRHGTFTNPWLANWLVGLQVDKFYAQPPFLPFALGAWLKLWGVSTRSLTAFHAVIQVVLGIMLYRGARHIGFSRAPALMLPLIATIGLADYGMRPDAMALVAVGGCFYSWRADDPARMIVAGFCGASAVATQPFMLSLVVPVFLYQWSKDLRATGTRQTAQRVLAPSVGIVLAVVTFSFAIGHEWPTFLGAFRRHAQLVTPPMSEAWTFLWHRVSFGMEPYRLAPALGWIALVVFVSSRKPSRWRRLWITLAAVTIIGVALYATYAVNYMIHLGLMLALLVWADLRSARVAIVVTSLLLSWMHLGSAMQFITAQPTDPQRDASLRETLLAHRATSYWLDAAAVRRLFDFNPPPHTQDFVNPFAIGEWHKIQPPEVPANGVLAGTAWTFEIKTSGFAITAPKVSFFSRSFNSMPAQPEPIIIWAPPK